MAAGAGVRLLGAGIGALGRALDRMADQLADRFARVREDEARLRAMLDSRGLHHVDIEVDGGITPQTAPLVTAAGANVLVAGSAVFKGGATRYTRNSTRVVPATPAALAARLAVKDETTNNGNIPEDYLLPEVVGGPRKEKRFERAMRYAGLLQGRERAVLGEYAPVDSFGNLRVGEIQRILTATRSAFA